jgi:hypothetical protein
MHLASPTAGLAFNAVVALRQFSHVQSLEVGRRWYLNGQIA